MGPGVPGEPQGNNRYRDRGRAAGPRAVVRVPSCRPEAREASGEKPATENANRSSDAEDRDARVILGPSLSGIPVYSPSRTHTESTFFSPLPLQAGSAAGVPPGGPAQSPYFCS